MKSLYIKNYKNLRELSIDSLARVNLICDVWQVVFSYPYE